MTEVMLLLRLCRRLADYCRSPSVTSDGGGWSSPGHAVPVLFVVLFCRCTTVNTLVASEKIFLNINTSPVYLIDIDTF